MRTMSSCLSKRWRRFRLDVFKLVESSPRWPLVRHMNGALNPQTSVGSIKTGFDPSRRYRIASGRRRQSQPSRDRELLSCWKVLRSYTKAVFSRQVSWQSLRKPGQHPRRISSDGGRWFAATFAGLQLNFAHGGLPVTDRCFRTTRRRDKANPA